jgi:hypothetical protein
VCGLSDRTDPEIQCDEIYESDNGWYIIYAVNTVVVNRMTRYQNQKILISNNKVMRDLE